MNFHADNYHCIGSSHKFCEDFSISSRLENRSFAIIADGCSSAENTSAGAMIMCQLLYGKLLENENISKYDLSYVVELIPSYAEYCRGLLGLERESLYSTLLAVATGKDGFHVVSIGDGCIFGRNKQGDIEVINLEYTSGAPYYLMYGYDDKKRKQYVEEFPGVYRRSYYEDKWKQSNEYVISEKESCHPYYYFYPFDEYDVVGVLSDGIHSFLLNQKEVPFIDILKDILAFKGLTGEFVKRRMQKAIKSMQKQEISHYDDLSISAAAIS
jgi:hypothetical protein